MYLPQDASRRRLREAENARRNRAEIIKALSHGQVSRRDLVRWGIFTATGALALKNGLSPFARSAYAGDIPTGVPPTPMFNATPFSQELPRLDLQKPHTMTHGVWNGQQCAFWPQGYEDGIPSKQLSYHTEFSESGGTLFRNPRTGVGPMEGRPPFEYFQQQRWSNNMPAAGYCLSLGRANGVTFHPGLIAQEPDRIWTFGDRRRGKRGRLPPVLIQARYGEPVITRIYNDLPLKREKNAGFGRHEPAIHNHNAHNASASDGASNAHFFPGQFYDYHWSTVLARADMINKTGTDARASGPDGNGGLITVPGDYREIQSSLWFHDHRFFFTAENVYKGFLGVLNYYSGIDRGNERLKDPANVNLRLPSGWFKDWGNVDFDVNLVVADWATDQEGQYHFDIFNTDGFLGDRMHVNFAYSPVFKVVPRKYRFRILNACMSRFIKLVLLDQSNRRVPVRVIANDGNLLVSPVRVPELETQGSAERFDIIVDFSDFQPGDTIDLCNLMAHNDGRGPDRRISPADMRRGDNRGDPAVGPVMRFEVVDQVESVDNPGYFHKAGDPDRSRVPARLTDPIPIVDTPVRTRHFEFKRGGASIADLTDCVPECGEKQEFLESFPWSVRINGESTHSLNANRISFLIPAPGEIEHWTIETGGGWDHPVHLHFEEGITLDRGGRAVPPEELHARKDVWRIGEGGQVRFQVQFGEFGGAYVMHCHNTVHEDFAMLMRYDILKDDDSVHASIIPTPNPSPEGVTYMNPEILPEGDPRIGARRS